MITKQDANTTDSARMLLGEPRFSSSILTAQSHNDVTINQVSNDKLCLKITFKYCSLVFGLEEFSWLRFWGKNATFDLCLHMTQL